MLNAQFYIEFQLHQFDFEDYKKRVKMYVCGLCWCLTVILGTQMICDTNVVFDVEQIETSVSIHFFDLDVSAVFIF